MFETRLWTAVQVIFKILWLLTLEINVFHWNFIVVCDYFVIYITIYLLTVTLGNSRVNMNTWQHQYLRSINLLLPAVTVNKCVMLPHRWYTLFTTCKSNEQSKWMWLNTLHRKSSLSFFLSEKCSADRWISNNYHHYSAISPGFCIQESLGLPWAF